MAISNEDSLRILAQLSPEDRARLSQISGAPAQAPTQEYTPQQNGGVTQGSRSPFDFLFGAGNVQTQPALISSLPDIGDADAIMAAQNQYQSAHDAWQQANSIEGHQAEQRVIDEISRTKGLNAAMTEAARYDQLTKNEPQPPDLSAVQKQTDRNRLLSLANGSYQPLIANQLAIATGQSTGAAEAAYRAAANDAARRSYGTAASAQGTGGQRAALFQAALGQEAETNQAAANNAAKIRGQEQQDAVQGLNAAMAGLTNVYGTPNLLGDTQKTQEDNQQARNSAILANAKLKEEDATNASQAAQGYVRAAGSTGGTLLSHVG